MKDFRWECFCFLLSCISIIIHTCSVMTLLSNLIELTRYFGSRIPISHISMLLLLISRRAIFMANVASYFAKACVLAYSFLGSG